MKLKKNRGPRTTNHRVTFLREATRQLKIIDAVMETSGARADPHAPGIASAGAAPGIGEGRL